MKIAIASDHGGVNLKEIIYNFLKNRNFEVEDLGTNDSTSVDYPIFADKLAKNILNKESNLGILVCGTGVGISIRANRHKGIRAALLYDDEVAIMAKKHNNANILVFGGRTMKSEDVLKRIELFLNTEFEGGRHQQRIDLLDM